MKRLSFAAIALLLLGVGCTGSYKGVPREAVLKYQVEPTLGNVYALGVDYAEAINAALAADTLHPGLYADYGVALALMGHYDAAARAFESEARAFPQSRGMMNLLKARMLPTGVADTFAMAAPDMAQLERWAYDSVAALQRVAVASVIDSTDSIRLMYQTPVDSVEYPIRLSATQKRLLLAEEQRREEVLRQAAQDSVAAAKQAAKDARKQQQADRKAAAKAAAKQKKQEAKEREKAKAEARKEADKAKAAQAKEREEAKAAAKREAEARKEAERRAREQQRKEKKK